MINENEPLGVTNSHMGHGEFDLGKVSRTRFIPLDQWIFYIHSAILIMLKFEVGPVELTEHHFLVQKSSIYFGQHR